MSETSASGKHTELGRDGFVPGPVLLLGAPGVGKGTQAKVLMSSFAIPQISTGDILRQHRREHTSLGLMADELMKRGDLVPDDLVNRMVAERLEEPDCVRGFVLDGFPRTLAQADWLDEWLAGREGALPVIAVSLRVEHEELLKRITGRRISPAGRIYNIYTQPPVVPGRCDLDGSKLEQRSDDTEPVFEQRMKTFYEQTAPVVDHYRRLHRFAEVDGTLSVDNVTTAITAVLTRFRVGSEPSQRQGV